MSDLILYHFEACPYCVRVRTYISENDIDVTLKDIRLNDRFRTELINIGGKPQVPCLVHNNQALYESADIIDWLQKNKDSK